MKLMVSSCSVHALGRFTEEEVKEDGEIVDIANSRIYFVYVYFSYYETYREIEYTSRSTVLYFKRLRSSGFVSLEAF